VSSIKLLKIYLYSFSDSAFELTSDEAFKDLVNFFNHRITLKDPSTFRKYKLPLLYNAVMGNVKDQLEKDLPHCKQIALTTDCWTSRAEDPFISLTLHYINKNFKLKKFILNFDNFTGRHTAYLLAKVIYIILKIS